MLTLRFKRLQELGLYIELREKFDRCQVSRLTSWKIGDFRGNASNCVPPLNNSTLTRSKVKHYLIAFFFSFILTCNSEEPCRNLEKENN